VSSLGLSLLILALVGVGGVLLYNYWLGGTFRRRLPDAREPEPLLRQEPRFGRVGAVSELDLPPGDEAVDAAAPDDESLPSTPDSLAAAAVESPSPERPPDGAEGAVISAQDRILEAQAARAGPPPPRPDPVADCCVAIDLATPVAAERLVNLARRFRRAGSKPVVIEASTEALAHAAAETAGVTDARQEAAGEGDVGREAADFAEEGIGAVDAVDAADATDMADATDAVPARAVHPWEAPTPGRHYRSLRVGILMANRHGPLNAMEYSEFVAGLQSLADSLGAFVDAPDMMRVLERARDLDARCAALDAQIGVNVEVSEALSPADLNGIAQSADVIERGNNRYARLGDQGEVVFSVALGDTPNRLTFLLDVPRVAAEREPLREMVACAWHCAQALQGRMVDDTGRALTDAVFTRIEAQLATRYNALAAAGFRAGSPLALRLFN